jgi:hypothetical protein
LGGHRQENHRLRTALNKNVKTLPEKLLKKNSGRGLAQVVERLPGNHEGPEFNPSTTRKKRIIPRVAPPEFSWIMMKLGLEMRVLN